ncbi:MAG: class I SAM-dependent rRNA methyltransferase [Saprospiraceae bacterium]
MINQPLKSIVVFNNKTNSILRRHPWIFSGAIKTKEETIEEGDLVNILNDKGEYLGFGYFQNNNISIKILGFKDEKYSNDFWKSRINLAFQLRSQLGLINNPQTNAYRLIHGEGDGLPGLIIDVYKDVAILQCHSIGIHKKLTLICEALEEVYALNLNHIYDKSQDTIPSSKTAFSSNNFLKGGVDFVLIKENGIEFEINIRDSQKTGFFLDQRENRKLLQKYCFHKDVLNTFCYTGGFSLYALISDAKSVTSIDSSTKAIAQLENNIILNKLIGFQHLTLNQEAIHYLNHMEKNLYDVIILDPPAFAKNISKRHNAIQAYKRINISALSKIKNGGILFTFSCSQVVTEELFYHTIISAGIETGRNIKILHKLHQAPDHPTSLFHPEGSYLKGMVLEVN